MNIVEIKKRIMEKFTGQNGEFMNVVVNSLNSISILIVSDKFINMNFAERRKFVLENIKIESPYQEGFLELYTLEEANYYNIEKVENLPADRISTWQELSLNYKNKQEVESKSDKHSSMPRVISFYSYKGGVGRTAALANVAYILAARGKKVVVVDMDIEAPGLINVFDNKRCSSTKYGLIDYFNDRVSSIDEFEKRVNITDIFTEVSYSDISGRLFVVPAGNLDIDYLAKVNSFNAKSIVSCGKDYWMEFIEDINKQIRPDIILVDSRTGLNDWGALSLLNISDSTIFFAYPNTENMNGLKVIIKAMNQSGYNNYNLVFSRIHDDKFGKQKVEELWDEFKNEFWSNENEGLAEPVKIFYSPELAVSDSFPVKNVYSIYSQLANLIDEEIEDDGLINILSGVDRWEIIKSLPYENLGFSEFEDDPSIFQRTVYLDKFLDEDVPIVSGKKGTGKTKMYTMMLNHLDNIKSISRVSLEKIIPLSGHGEYSERPIEEFEIWAKKVEAKECNWENIWKAYLLVVLQKNSIRPTIKGDKYKRIKDIISKVKKDTLGWKYEYTEIVNVLASSYEVSLLMQDYLSEIDACLGKKSEKLWILYDKLDEDLEKRQYGKAAMEGLFKLIQIFEGKHIKNIKFKIFIRQDIWDTMEFTNKSHFKGRTINLEWNKQDFLKLALRISLKSELFSKVISKYRPIPQDIDYMTVDGLKEGLQILWGIRRESSKRSQYVVNWIYERLTDADENTFPRSLFMLLQGAKEQELTYEYANNIQTPKDRFLRSASLNNGLKMASIERCDALKQEYSDLSSAFERFGKFSDTFTYTQFEDIYNDGKWNPKELIHKLKKIGVISEKDDGTYKFAYIYIYGFKVTRSSKI